MSCRLQHEHTQGLPSVVIPQPAISVTDFDLHALLQAANQAALTFAQQFPGNLEDIARLHKSITDELDARKAKAESLASKRAAERERQSAALSRSHSDPQPASQGAPQLPKLPQHFSGKWPMITQAVPQCHP